MIDVPLRYQVSFFADMREVRPSADTITPLLEAFKDRNLLPETFQEISPFVAAPESRLRMCSADNEWTIDLDSNRISVEKKAVKPQGANLGAEETYVNDAITFLCRVLEHFPRKGVRLGLVTKGLMAELPESQLFSMYGRVFSPLQFYRDNPPTAWNSRSVSRVSVQLKGCSERLNVITGVNRIQGNLLGEKFDRVEVEFDINTYQGSMESRFSVDDLKQFLLQALRIRSDILIALEKQFNA